MAKVIDKTIISDKSYDFKVEPWMLKKSLAHHLFEQQAKRQFPGSENQVKINFDQMAISDVFFRRTVKPELTTVKE